MQTRKKRRRFETIIIKTRDIWMFVLLSAILVGFTAIVISTEGLLLKDGKNLIKTQLPMISTQKNTDSFKKIFSDIISSQYVLADTLPMLIDSKKEKNEILREDFQSTVESDILPQVPQNFLPIKNSSIIGKNLNIKNETTYQPDIEALLYAPLAFKSPEVLIVHTHASESYSSENQNYYIDGVTDRTLDTSLNVVRVGEELCNELKRYGINVFHAKNINDSPSYNKSYSKTLSVINSYLESNSNIQIVIDLHRDSVIKADGTKFKFTNKINGENVAQLMIVCGTNQAGLENDTWQENMKFAIKLQNYMEINFPGLARPLNLRQERFNTHATKGSFIIEVGTGGNTLDEANRSMKYFAKTISEVIKPYN